MKGLSRQNIDAADARRAVHMGITHLGFARHLSGATVASKLYTDLVDLTQTRGANGLPVGETAAICVHREPPGDLCYAIRQPLFLIAVGAYLVLSAMCIISAPTSVS